jgi:hemerythrin
MSLVKEGFLSWSDRYNVGLDFVDEQHRKIIDIANDLHKGTFALEHEGVEKSRSEAFRDGMSAAVEYVKTHFSAEEEFMRSLNYPQYAEHKGLHEEFIRRLLQDAARFEAGDQRVGLQFVYFLRDWLLEHIAIVDKVLAAYARSKGILH